MNLANRITLARIFLVPVFLVIVLLRLPYGDFIAAGIFVLAASTDSLDGYIARSRNQITNFGKFLDPIADKLLVTAALVLLVEMGRLPSWVAVLIIGREFVVTGLRVVAASEGIVIAASNLGKLKTVTQIVAIVAILVRDYPFSLWHIPVGAMAMTLAVIATVWSGADYIYKAKDLIKPVNK